MSKRIDPGPEQVVFMLGVPFGSSSSVLLGATEVQTKVYTDSRDWSPTVTTVSVRYRPVWSTDGMTTVQVAWNEEEGRHIVTVHNLYNLSEDGAVTEKEVPFNV